MAKHLVKCPICNQQFDANVEPYVMINARRYAHKACAEVADKNKTKEEKDKEQLENYIKNLFGISSITPKIRKQIDTFHKDKNYSYSGMYKTLRYHFEIKKGSLEKANGGIGIIPFVWNDALVYWRALWEAQQQNKDVEIQDFVLPAREVHIIPPQRQPMKHTRKLFGFLDEEVEK